MTPLSEVLRMNYGVRSTEVIEWKADEMIYSPYKPIRNDDAAPPWARQPRSQTCNTIRRRSLGGSSSSRLSQHRPPASVASYVIRYDVIHDIIYDILSPYQCIDP
jgi:hypothetical protein